MSVMPDGEFGSMPICNSLPVAGFNKLVKLTKLVKKNLVKIVVN